MSGSQRIQDAISEKMPADTTSSVAVSVLLFASLKDAARADCIVVRVDSRKPDSAYQANGQTAHPASAQTTVAALLESCARQYPQLAPWLPHVRVAVNCEYADAASPISPGDEVALLPPVSGGARREYERRRKGAGS